MPAFLGKNIIVIDVKKVIRVAISTSAQTNV